CSNVMARKLHVHRPIARCLDASLTLYAWRKQMAGDQPDADQAVATFARVDVSDLPEVERPVADCAGPAGRIVVAFPNGARLRIDGTVDPTALRIVLAELTR
ncbi:hypothetical protein RFM51_30410, partial [Mesorhizobium sp. VK3E]|nr:hypothetical protein [Mesorhizobium sp. VK3E]